MNARSADAGQANGVMAEAGEMGWLRRRRVRFVAAARLPIPREDYHPHSADRAHRPHKGERRWHLVRPLHRRQSGLRRLGAKQTMLPPRGNLSEPRL